MTENLLWSLSYWHRWDYVLNFLLLVAAYAWINTTAIVWVQSRQSVHWRFFLGGLLKRNVRGRGGGTVDFCAARTHCFAVRSNTNRSNARLTSLFYAHAPALASLPTSPRLLVNRLDSFLSCWLISFIRISSLLLLFLVDKEKGGKDKREGGGRVTKKETCSFLLYLGTQRRDVVSWTCF